MNNRSIELACKLVNSQGFNETNLKEVGVFKGSNKRERHQFLYGQGLIIVLKGEKNIYAENKTFTYNSSNYLTVTVPMPLECQDVTENSECLLALTIKLSLSKINQIINELGDEFLSNSLPSNESELGIYTDKVDEKFKNIIERLLEVLQDKNDTKILGQSILTELYYHLLKGRGAGSLSSLAIRNTHLSRIDSVLKDIHTNFDRSFDIDSLAKKANMSSSSFHTTFKNVTSSSPIQYIKKLRLNKAKDFLLQGELRVNEVARKVGYESVSQFNREFKRYFGETPGSI